ncbi:10444_t:CDS:2, partial [Gigaspora margarita]
HITQQSFARLCTIGQQSLACSAAHDIIFSCRYQSNVPPPPYTNQYNIYIDQPNYTLLSTSHIDNLETTESTPFQPIQSTSSETIIDIDSTSTPLESDNLNTETSQTSIEVAITTPLPNTSFFPTSTPTKSSEITVEFGSEVYNISTSTIEFEQDQTTTFYSVPLSPIQILNSRSAPVSPIIPPTFFKISSTPPNISLLTSTADYWSSVAINHNIEQSSSSSYTLLYPQLDTNSDSEQSFEEAFTAILDQVQNNNTDNQDLSFNHSISDEESNSSD